MATYNGRKYIKEQIDSILSQLSDDDELVISDDHSTDGTAEFIMSYNDKRIKFFYNELPKGVTHNFENALLKSRGEVLFLADQDDVWLPNKLADLLRFMVEGNYDVVVCNCALVDENLNMIKESYYDENFKQKKTLWRNFIKNSWLGSCMAFKREVLETSLPFPRRVVAHDLWICMIAQMYYHCGYTEKVLQLYRRHDATVSFAGGKSENGLLYRLNYRMYLACYLLKHFLRHRLFKK